MNPMGANQPWASTSMPTPNPPVQPQPAVKRKAVTARKPVGQPSAINTTPLQHRPSTASLSSQRTLVSETGSTASLSSSATLNSAPATPMSVPTGAYQHLPGWSGAHDADGRAFYIHLTTKKSTWTHPAHLPLRPGWEERRSSDGRVFYYYSQTQTTTWERPFVDFQTCKPQPQAVPGWSMASAPDGRQYFIHLHSKKTTWNHPVSLPLSPGWEERRNPDGKTFYLHPTTQSTSWQRPCAGFENGPGSYTYGRGPIHSNPMAPAPQPATPQSAVSPSTSTGGGIHWETPSNGRRQSTMSFSSIGSGVSAAGRATRPSISSNMSSGSIKTGAGSTAAGAMSGVQKAGKFYKENKTAIHTGLKVFKVANGIVKATTGSSILGGAENIFDGNGGGGGGSGVDVGGLLDAATSNIDMGDLADNISLSGLDVSQVDPSSIDIDGVNFDTISLGNGDEMLINTDNGDIYEVESDGEVYSEGEVSINGQSQYNPTGSNFNPKPHHKPHQKPTPSQYSRPTNHQQVHQAARPTAASGKRTAQAGGAGRVSRNQSVVSSNSGKSTNSASISTQQLLAIQAAIQLGVMPTAEPALHTSNPPRKKPVKTAESKVRYSQVSLPDAVAWLKVEMAKSASVPDGDAAAVRNRLLKEYFAMLNPSDGASSDIYDGEEDGQDDVAVGESALSFLAEQVDDIQEQQNEFSGFGSGNAPLSFKIQEEDTVGGKFDLQDVGAFASRLQDEVKNEFIQDFVQDTGGFDQGSTIQTENFEETIVQGTDVTEGTQSFALMESIAVQGLGIPEQAQSSLTADDVSVQDVETSQQTLGSGFFSLESVSVQDLGYAQDVQTIVSQETASVVNVDDFYGAPPSLVIESISTENTSSSEVVQTTSSQQSEIIGDTQAAQNSYVQETTSVVSQGAPSAFDMTGYLKQEVTSAEGGKSFVVKQSVDAQPGAPTAFDMEGFLVQEVASAEGGKSFVIGETVTTQKFDTVQQTSEGPIGLQTTFTQDTVSIQNLDASGQRIPGTQTACTTETVDVQSLPPSSDSKGKNILKNLLKASLTAATNTQSRPTETGNPLTTPLPQSPVVENQHSQSSYSTISEEVIVTQDRNVFHNILKASIATQNAQNTAPVDPINPQPETPHPSSDHRTAMPAPQIGHTAETNQSLAAAQQTNAGYQEPQTSYAGSTTTLSREINTGSQESQTSHTERTISIPEFQTYFQDPYTSTQDPKTSYTVSTTSTQSIQEFSTPPHAPSSPAPKMKATFAEHMPKRKPAPTTATLDFSSFGGDPFWETGPGFFGGNAFSNEQYCELEATPQQSELQGSAVSSTTTSPQPGTVEITEGGIKGDMVELSATGKEEREGREMMAGHGMEVVGHEHKHYVHSSKHPGFAHAGGKHEKHEKHEKERHGPLPGLGFEVGKAGAGVLVAEIGE